MHYGEYYLILPNAWTGEPGPVAKRLGADQTWQSVPHLYPASSEEDLGEGASTLERIWFSRRLDQLNILAHDNPDADNVIRYNGSSGLLGYDGGGPFVDWGWNLETGYFKRAWSTRCDDAPGYGGDDDRPVSSAADNIRICRQLLGIEALHGRFNFPWMESYDTGKETADPCTGLGLLALMEAAGRLVGWREDRGYFSDKRGFGGGTLSGSIDPVYPFCPFEEANPTAWVLHDVTAVARHYISIHDPEEYTRMYLLAWKHFVLPPREQWPGGFIKFNHDPVEVCLWPSS